MAPSSPRPSGARSTAAARGRRSAASAGDATRGRILAVAEQQFAERGIDAVSIRDITTAADVNLASIHYHFGSKRDLVAAIIEQRSGEVLGHRVETLDRLEAAEAVTLRDLAEAMVRPAAVTLADRRARSYIGFMAAVGAHPDYHQLVTDITDRHTVRQLRLLERLTPDLPPPTRQFRFALAKAVLVNQAFGQPGQGVRLWVQHHEPAAEFDFAEEDGPALATVSVNVIAPPADRRARGDVRGPCRNELASWRRRHRQLRGPMVDAVVGRGTPRA